MVGRLLVSVVGMAWGDLAARKALALQLVQSCLCFEVRLTERGSGRAEGFSERHNLIHCGDTTHVKYMCRYSRYNILTEISDQYCMGSRNGNIKLSIGTGRHGST